MKTSDKVGIAIALTGLIGLAFKLHSNAKKKVDAAAKKADAPDATDNGSDDGSGGGGGGGYAPPTVIPPSGAYVPPSSAPPVIGGAYVDPVSGLTVLNQAQVLPNEPGIGFQPHQGQSFIRGKTNPTPKKNVATKRVGGASADGWDGGSGTSLDWKG